MNLGPGARVHFADPERFSNPGLSKKAAFVSHLSPILNYMKKIFIFLLALLAVIITLYAGLNGLMEDHAYGTFFTFVGAITTVGLGVDIVNHLKLEARKNTLRKLGGR